jgi:hypothetical protein
MSNMKSHTYNKNYFLKRKKVVDFSATRVRLEGVGSPEWQKYGARGPDRKWNSRSGKTVLFLKSKDEIFFAKLAFSAVICGI